MNEAPQTTTRYLQTLTKAQRNRVQLVKHLGSAHDQMTHGRRKTGTGSIPAYKNEVSPKGKYSDEAVRLAKELRDKRVAAEGQTTADMAEAAAAHGFDLGGLAFRVKTEESLARKIDSVHAETRTPRSEVAGQIGDVLRYTGIIAADKYLDGAKAFLADLEAKGYGVNRVKNFWPVGDAYQGINVKVKHPDGFDIELQFHTPETYVVKEESHKLYSKYRIEENPAARLDYWNKMVDLWAPVRIPEDILSFGDLVLEEFSPTLQKAAGEWKYLLKRDDNGKVLSRYRYKKTDKEFVEQRLDGAKWVDTMDASCFLILGTWDYEPYEPGMYSTTTPKPVSKHLGSTHDQQTHGRRKTTTMELRPIGGGRMALVPKKTKPVVEFKVPGPLGRMGMRLAYQPGVNVKTALELAKQTSKRLLDDPATREAYWKGFSRAYPHETIQNRLWRSRQWEGGSPEEFAIRHLSGVNEAFAALWGAGKRTAAWDLANKTRSLTALTQAIEWGSKYMDVYSGGPETRAYNRYKDGLQNQALRILRDQGFTAKRAQQAIEGVFSTAGNPEAAERLARVLTSGGMNQSEANWAIGGFNDDSFGSVNPASHLQRGT